MAWKDNPIGIVLDATKTADLKKLKEEGLSFVVVEAAVGPNDRHPKLSEVVQAAYDADLPLLLMFTPWPDQEEYTLQGNIQSHLAMLRGVTVNHKHYAYIVNADRYWTGTDYEEYQKGTRPYNSIRWSTNANISDVASNMVNTIKKHYSDQGKTTPVMVRTSDTFVQGKSPNMASWVGNNPFYLADWRYRMPNPDDAGKYTKYVSYSTTPTPIETVAALRAQLPPAEAKNPLVPGANTPLKFWEFSGRRFVHPSVKDVTGKPTAASFVLFNGDTTALNAFLSFTPKGGPGGPGGPGDEPGGDPTEFEIKLAKALDAFAKAWLEIE